MMEDKKVISLEKRIIDGREWKKKVQTIIQDAIHKSLTGEGIVPADKSESVTAMTRQVMSELFSEKGRFFVGRLNDFLVDNTISVDAGILMWEDYEHEATKDR